MTSPAVHDVIEPLAKMLALDGYRLVVREERAGRLSLAVEADASACAGCLMPRAVFVAVVQRHLAEQGIATVVDVAYPSV